MRLVIDKYKIITDKKLERPIRVILISDIHITESLLTLNDVNLISTFLGIKKVNDIDIFALSGDFVNNAQELKNPKVRRTMARFLSELGKIGKVIMVRGNHDLFANDIESERIYEDFRGIENVYLLDNHQIDTLGINVTGFAPRHESYDLIKHGKRSHEITINDFCQNDFKFNKNKFNLILTHSPYSLTNKRALKNLPHVYENADLILSGHLHNGMATSRNIDLTNNKMSGKKYVDIGFWVDPKTGFISKHCRGAKLVGNGEIGKTILPSSKKFVEIDLTKNPDKLVQITGKGINKFSVIPIIIGKPSVVEVLITRRDFEKDGRNATK